jgi:hypothetical protein
MTPAVAVLIADVGECGAVARVGTGAVDRANDRTAVARKDVDATGIDQKTAEVLTRRADEYIGRSVAVEIADRGDYGAEPIPQDFAEILPDQSAAATVNDLHLALGTEVVLGADDDVVEPVTVDVRQCCDRRTVGLTRVAADARVTQRLRRRIRRKKANPKSQNDPISITHRIPRFSTAPLLQEQRRGALTSVIADVDAVDQPIRRTIQHKSRLHEDICKYVFGTYA